MRYIILSSVAFATLKYGSTLSHERHNFRKMKLVDIKCLFWFSVQLWCTACSGDNMALAMRMLHVAISCSSGYAIFFFTLSHKRHDFLLKKWLNTKCVFWFSPRLSETFFFLRMNSTRKCHKCSSVITWSSRYSLQILIKLEFSRQTFEKSTNIKFHENPCGQGGSTYRHDETNTLSSQFYECA
jgi:hypothetical protein